MRLAYSRADNDKLCEQLKVLKGEVKIDKENKRKLNLI